MLVTIADAFSDPPVGLLCRLSLVAFSIFVSWIIGRCSTASRSHSEIRRLLFFTTSFLLSFKAQHTGTKDEYAICWQFIEWVWRFVEWVRRFADLRFFVLSASFYCFLLSTVHALPQTSNT
ncbi:hypothetical protein MTR67_034259 [Solanum verrucosum]|uniref:Uncharacterized protein n=1 Tax=Solanum verrucosum TaxID=315347 RepID=A0AAF0U891_SOLVR|nr:hypothetical protein MTR67_034259 [Solanum verrucosum]